MQILEKYRRLLQILIIGAMGLLLLRQLQKTRATDLSSKKLNSIDKSKSPLKMIQELIITLK